MMDEKIVKIKEWLLDQEKMGNFKSIETNDYMLGLYNGVELSLAVLEDRQPKFKHK
jgi:predicted Zn-dependent protease with MMP-like domain